MADSFAALKVKESNELEVDNLGGEGERRGTSFFGLVGEVSLGLRDRVLFFEREERNFEIGEVEGLVRRMFG